ncbi:5-formyltetrahydrofolate cyclo-ligase [Lacticaseibacillus brantae]|uniref:5-formyltetrahydrofolate cyclo-ligase n=1 Tax=Lacticaseibacillus brantae DSM 23927 TaxID=1423727 RepID=A0A0R2B1U2_9LACO|nr:5-formyltetrahydrofolate cyclo-ligase [Lacticaseibacillus brantae]KRM71940.1 5-formyltetrahydrofolate cyclo-ligase [Lacticaseibacillus brantae DSM 23927]
MNKNDFRKAQIAQLNAHAAQTQAAGADLLRQLLTLPVWQHANTIATTVSSPIEVPTEPLIKAAKAAGKTVYLPKTMPKRQLAFLPDDGPRITSKFGIPEPAFDVTKQNQNVDLVIVPGVAFSLDCHYRLGFGAGYYDRFLAEYSGPTVSLVAPVQQFDTAQWPVEIFDWPVDTLITTDLKNSL